MKFTKAVLALSLILTIGVGNAMAEKAPEGIQHITDGAQSVTFPHGPWKMAGNLYMPPNIEMGKTYPAIITVHPGGGVKEQTSGLYAKKMAEKGFITLAFDASHQGASEGLPRNAEIPTERVEDIRCAVDYLTTLPQVDKDKIGLIGICAGGGYSLSAAQTEHRIKAVATISGVDIGEISRRGWDGKGTLNAQLDALNAIAAQRTAEANGAPVKYNHIVPEKDEITPDTPNDIVEASDYYRTPRGQHPNSNNLSMFSCSDAVFAFHAWGDIDTLLTQPVLFIAGTEAGSLWQSKAAYDKATSPKELYLVDGATHMDLYDITEYVNQAVEKLNSFFQENLVK